jgi:imidazolonepropionase-like amidohydrolase
MTRLTIGLILLCSLLQAVGARPDAARQAEGAAPAQSLALRGGRIVTVSGEIIEGGTLPIRDGLIVALGRDAPVPAGIKTLDVAGQTVLPGFIDGFTTLGTGDLPSFGSEEDEAVDPVTPQLRVIDGVNPDNRFIPLARREGVTAALSAPGEGNLISGRSALIRLVEGSLEEMVLRFPVAVHVTIGEAPKQRYGPKGKAPGTRMGEIALLRQTLLDAQQYSHRKAAAARKPAEGAGPKAPVPTDLKLEALLPVLAGSLPMIVSADRRDDILAAVRVADEYRLKMILSHGSEAHRIAGVLAARHIPVILGPSAQGGLRIETLGARDDAAVLLQRAGVKIAFQSGTHGDAVDLLAQARSAVALGLPEEEATKALTLYPAQILGVADRLGSLEAGKIGDVLVFGGNPLRELAPLNLVILGGRAFRR